MVFLILVSFCIVIRKTKRRYFKDEAFLTAIGIKIRTYRNQKNLSIEQLANDCEVDSTQIGRMELGKVNFSISFLSKIAYSLNVSPKELLP